MATLLGQYDFIVADVGTPTVTITLAADLLDSAGTYGAGEGESRQEFRRLPGNVVAALFDAIRAGAEDIVTTLVEMDLDTADFPLWDQQVDKCFILVKNGFLSTHTLDRDFNGTVHEFRLNRIP